MNNRRKFIIAPRSGALAKPAGSFAQQPAPGRVRIGCRSRVVWRNARRMVATEGNIKIFRLTMVTTEPLAKV